MKLLSHRVMGIHVWTKVRKSEHLPARFYFTPKAEFPLCVAYWDSQRMADQGCEEGEGWIPNKRQ